MKFSVFIVSICFILNGCASTAVAVSCVLDPPIEPEPTIERASFNITIDYYLNGDRKSFADVGTCQYLGRKCDGRGLHNNWEFSLASGIEDIVLLELNGDEEIQIELDACSKLMASEISGDPYVVLARNLEAVRSGKTLERVSMEKEYGIRINGYSVERAP